MPRQALPLLALPLLAGGVAFALPASPLATAPGSAPGELLVRYRGDHAPFRRLRLDPAADLEPAIRSLRSRSDVLSVSRNHLFHLSSTPNDPGYRHQWNFQSSVAGSARVDAAWDVIHNAGRIPGYGAIVAVIDTGASYESYVGTGLRGTPVQFAIAPDLVATQFLFPRNVIREDQHANDDVGHGTHVTGTIAAGTNDATGEAGIASAAAIIPISTAELVRNEIQLPESAIAEGLRWAADHGAHVINMSFGGSTGADILADSVSYCRQQGCLLVAAAGNSGKKGIDWPAAFSAEVLAVSATGYQGRLARYSSFGPGVALAAPGGDVATDLNRDGYPDGIVQQSFFSMTDPTQFGDAILEGTSMASAHVSGVAALVVGCGVTNGTDVRGVLERTAIPPGIRYDQRYGWGRLDAAAAATEALQPAARITPRSIQVDGLQLLVRQNGAQNVPELKIHLTDPAFYPIANAQVTVAWNHQKTRSTLVTDATGLAAIVGPPVRSGAGRVRARVLSVMAPGMRLDRKRSMPLTVEAAVPKS